MALQGKVISGLGEGSFWVKKIANVFKEKTGMNLFYGTLNIELDKPYKLGEDIIIVHKKEYGGAEELYFEPCKMNGYDAYIIRTAKSESGEGGHPLTILEIMSDVNLRDKFGLKDGDNVLISV